MIRVNGTPLDPALVALPLTIQHGRTAAGIQPDAPVAEFEYLNPTVPFALADPVTVELDLPVAGTHATWGDPVVTWADFGYGWGGSQLSTVTRFTGHVATLTAREENGIVVSWRVGCVGTQARLGGKFVDLSRPQETDVARVQAIMADIGAPVNILGSKTIELEPDNIFKDGLSALQEICSWTAGILWQGRDGVMNYETADARAGDAESVLPESAIVDGIEWSSTYLEVLNHVVVTWGPQETQNTYRDDTSIAQWGFRHVEIGTKIRNQQDADEFGNTVLIRRAQPYWVMPGVVINSEDCNDAEYWETNLLKLGMGVVVDIPHDPGPIGDIAVWTVEGWVEVWDTPYNQRLQIALTDRDRWGAYALRRWDGMNLQPWSHWVPYTWLELLASDTPAVVEGP